MAQKLLEEKPNLALHRNTFYEYHLVIVHIFISEASEYHS